MFFILLLTWFPDPRAATQAQPASDPKRGPEKAAEIKTMLNDRHDLLKEVVARVVAQYKVGVADFARVAQAERDLLRATLELEEDLGKRIALLQEGEKTAKEIMDIVDRRFKVGTITPVDLLQAKVNLLEVQIELRRAESKVTPRK
jgi:outer membrane protein TolC